MNTEITIVLIIAIASLAVLDRDAPRGLPDRPCRAGRRPAPTSQDRAVRPTVLLGRMRAPTPSDPQKTTARPDDPGGPSACPGALNRRIPPATVSIQGSLLPAL